MSKTVLLGFEVGSGDPVQIPLRHMIVTGQTQEAGKTTALEALIARSGVKAIAFITKRGEGSFAGARTIAPYFREQADWQFVASILEASRGEKLKFERAWIIRASRGARTLADVQRNVQKAMETAKGMSADVYLTLDAYLEAVVPQISKVRWAPRVELSAGISAMDLTGLNVEMQHLVIRSTIDWVLNHETDTVVVVPEAWKFIPQGRGTPVKLAAESFIRQAAGLRNYLWLDSQDIAGVEKMILKSVPVWILGVQRESNEIKRTLDQIPAGIKKPKPDAIATLGLGQFYACHGTHVRNTYVQPTWLTDAQARAVARGELGVGTAAAPAPAQPARVHTTMSVTPSAVPDEVSVTEEEARALREENARLREQLEEATRGRPVAAVEKSVGPDGQRGEFVREPGKVLPGSTTHHPIEGTIELTAEPQDVDAIYAEVKRRLVVEAPGLLRVLTIKPELEVVIERKTVTAEGSTLKGRVARLLAAGFYGKPTTTSATRTELKKTGTDPGGGGNLSDVLKGLVRDGFLRDENDGYVEVPNMKVNIVERG